MQNNMFNELNRNQDQSTWEMPESLPSLSTAKIISIDTETRDPDILQKGPGWATNNGYVVGVSIKTDDGYQKYFPVRHEQGPNLDPDTVFQWLKIELSRPNQLKVGQNIIYDIGWLRHEGVKVEGPFYCTQTAEWLIDESRRASLAYLGNKYLGDGKTEDRLYQYCADMFGGKPDRAQAGNIWRAPAHIVGPYAEGDVDLPLRLMPLQQKLLDKDELNNCFQTEMGLINLLVDMRMRGIRVDIPKAKNIQTDLQGRIERDQNKLDNYAGFHVNVDANADIATLFDNLGLTYTKTSKSQEASFTHTFLKNNKHEITDLILDLRKWKKFLSTFINGYIFEYEYNGRLHPEFNQNGAVSGRFSCSNPNMQNIPSKDEELAPLIRSLFLPEPGESIVSLDYSQIEYMYLIHLGNDEIANKFKQMYHEDNTLDIHQFVADLMGVDRKPGKNLNFGIVYGLGLYALADSLNRSIDDAKQLKRQYETHFPFASKLMKQAMEVVQKRGWVKTLLGRRSRYNRWEPRKWELRKNVDPLPRQEALKKWGNQIQRAYQHTGLNRVIQGSAADIMKMAMVNIYNSGVLDVLGAPLLTIHDELVFSKPNTKAGNDAIQETKYIMENCVKLSLPLRVDMEEGNNWGELK